MTEAVNVKFCHLVEEATLFQMRRVLALETYVFQNGAQLKKLCPDL